MTCLCCLGFMIEDQFLDLKSPYGQMWVASLRCGNCGHVHDSAIKQFHLARQEKGVARPSSEPDYQDDEVHLGAESIIRRAA
jgi:hypothetical protein